MPDSSYEVLPDDELLRRVKLPVPPKTETDYIKVFDDGSKEITRLAFRPDPVRDKDGLSVNILNLASSTESLFSSKTHTGAVIEARHPIELDCPCVHDPIEHDFSHALIQNLMDQRQKQVKLALACRIL